VGWGPRGEWLGCEDARFVVIDPAKKTLVAEHPVNGCDGAAFSPDGRWLLCGSYGRAELYEVATGALAATFPFEKRTAQEIRFSADGKRAVLGSGRGSEMWDVTARKRLGEAQHNDEAVAIEPNGARWAVSRASAPARVHTPDEKKAVDLPGGTEWLKGIAFLPDGRVIAGNQDGILRAWDASSGALVAEAKVGGWTDPIVASPDGKRLCTSMDEHGLIIDAATLKTSKKFQVAKRNPVVMAFSRDGARLLCGAPGDDGWQLQVIDL
jgi:WD40 repeat protein